MRGLHGFLGAALMAAVSAKSATAAVSAGSAAGRDPAKEAVIVAELKGVAPEVVPDFEAATRSLDAREWASAAAGFRRVLDRAPKSDATLRRLGSCLIQQGQVKEGQALQEQALSLRRSPENLYSAAAGLVLPVKKGEKPSRAISARALSLLKEAVRLRPDDVDCLVLKAQIELDLDELGAFRETSHLLTQRFPGMMATHYFAAVRAAIDEEWGAAEREIREAGRLGLPDKAVEGFLASGVGVRARAWKWARVVAWATGGWAVGLLLLFVVGKGLSSLTLSSIERDDPNQGISGAARRLRSVYRTVVAFAGLYWYASLPFVAVLVLAATAAVFYAFLVIGRIPIKLAAIIAVGALVSLYAIVRSLFIRIPEDENPGRAVPEADAPELWKTVREVASEVGTRPVDEIWLTPGTDLAVFERGRPRERMTDSARRALLLGAGVLDGFDQGPFRAVLAHEYGHFAHRDTAGGDIALRVRNGMRTFAIALANAGFAVSWNLAFQFLRVFDFLFRRVSHGATRLQEVLADQVAIRRFGFEAFRTGLTHVIRKSVLFEKLAAAEIDQAVEQRRLIANLYSLAMPSDPEAVADLERRVAAALNETTTEDNTHPGPADRFRLGQRIRTGASSSVSGSVWELFRDPKSVMGEMTSVVAKQVAASTDAPVAG